MSAEFFSGGDLEESRRDEMFLLENNLFILLGSPYGAQKRNDFKAWLILMNLQSDPGGRDFMLITTLEPSS